MSLEQVLVLDLLEQVPRLVLVLDEFVEVVGHLFCETLLVDEFQLDLFPRLFIELVDGGADRLELSLFTARKLDHGVKELPVVHLDAEASNS